MSSDSGTARVATLWQLGWNDERVTCAVYRGARGFQLRLESPTGETILTEPFDLQPRTLARSKALHKALRRRGWQEPQA